MNHRNTVLQRYLHNLDSPTSIIHRLTLFGILILGFLLRWYLLREGHGFNVDTIRDEVNSVKYALALLAGKPDAWYLAQPAIHQGHLPGPLWTLLVAGLYKLGGNSASGALHGMMILNTLAIIPIYLFASRLLTARYALFAVLCFALSPWPVYYSAGLYNPMALPFISACLFWALWHTLSVPRTGAVFWVLLLSAAMVQFHIIGIFYYPAIALLLWFSPARISLSWLAVGVLAGIGLYMPYLIGEMTHHWANLHAILSEGEKFNWGVLKYLTAVPEMLSNHPGGWTGDQMADLKTFGNHYFGSYWVLLAINLISFGLALAFVYSPVRKFFSNLFRSGFNLRVALREQPRTAFIGLLLILPLLLYTLLGKDYASRYSIIIFPLLFVLPGLYIENTRRAGARRMILLTLSVMFVCNIYLIGAFGKDQARKLADAPPYKPAFYKLARLYKALRSDAGTDDKIVLDLSHFPVRNNHYRQVASEAIPNYIAARESYPPHAETAKAQRYLLTNSPATIPPGYRIVFRDVGLVVSTK